MIIEMNGEPKGTKIGDLDYGTVVTGVHGHSSCVYIKIRKHKCGRGVSVDYTKNYCVLVNLESGTLREIHGNTKVTVLEAYLKVSQAEKPGYFLKHQEYRR